jgi:hypothetical protein
LALRMKSYMYFLVTTILLGILSRVYVTGLDVLDKYLGDGLYAMMVYLLISLIWMRMDAFVKIGGALLIMLLIEMFQLSNIPLQMSESENVIVKVLAILLGTRFSWLDLLSYMLGILFMYWIDQHYLVHRKDSS